MAGEGGHLDGWTRATGIATGLTAAAGALGDIAGNAAWAPWCYALAAVLGVATAAVFASAHGRGADPTRPVPAAPGPRLPSVVQWAVRAPTGNGDDWDSLLRRLDAKVAAIPTQEALPKLAHIPSTLAKVVARWSTIEGHLKLVGVPREELALDQTAGPRANWLEGVEGALEHERFARLLDQIHRELAPRPRAELEQAVRATVEDWDTS